MKIAVACDHAAIKLKLSVKAHLTEKGHVCEDFGCGEGERADYPDYAELAARAVLSGECEMGILFCGTGVGMSIAANKIPGIRCAVCSEPYSAELTRRHNDANMLALGARIVAPEFAAHIADAFVDAPFEGGGRHEIRVEKIAEIERRYPR